MKNTSNENSQEKNQRISKELENVLKFSNLKDKPRKEDLVIQFHEWVTNHHHLLNFCSIPSSVIKNWALEPWHYNSLKKVIKWINDVFMPEIYELEGILNLMTPSQWNNLAAIDRYHPEIVKLNKQKQRVHRIWLSRPRFKGEKGRVKKSGY